MYLNKAYVGITMPIYKELN